MRPYGCWVDGVGSRPAQPSSPPACDRAHHVAMRRRLLLIGGIATLGGALGVLAKPALDSVRRSLRTSSSPGVGAYDRVAGVFLGGYYDGIAADCAGVLASMEHPAILEVGPGPGHLAERLLTRIPGASWTGLDVDPAMLAAAARRLAAAGLVERSATVDADVAAMPFDDGAFDLVVSSLSAHHWLDAEAGFREIRRVLRPGGVALVFDLSPLLGHAETGLHGLRTAAAAFGESEWRRYRGAGPWTLVWRVELTAQP